MAHEISIYDANLPVIEDAFAGDSRVLAFQVVDDDGNAVDISNATVAWELFDREYQTESADAVLDGGDAAVELVTDNRVDSANGEWEVRLDPAATEDRWGEYWHRPEVTQSDGSVASWRGELVIEA